MSRISSSKSNGHVVLKTLLISGLDVFSIIVSFFLGLWLRFDFHFSEIPLEYLNGYLSTILVWCAISITVFHLCNLYNSIWVYVGMDEVFRVIGAYMLLAVLGLLFLAITGLDMPRSYYILGYVFSLICTTAIRFSYRLLRNLVKQLKQNSANKNGKNIMLIGAGEAGRSLALEFSNS